MAVQILSFDCSVLVKNDLEELIPQNENAASEELKELLGCQPFESVNKVLDILITPNLHLNHGEKLTRHIEPFIDWSNEEGNLQGIVQFLEGENNNTDVVDKIKKLSKFLW